MDRDTPSEGRIGAMTPERWSRVESLFVSAIDVPPERRRAWVERACADDPELRNELESLLAADARAGDGTFITSAIAAAAESIGVEADSKRIGERVGAYRLVAEIGHGGMGTVYLAERDDGQYEAKVAIKFVRGAFAGPDVLERLRRERQILADLAHPNIARLLDGGAAADGTPYLVMEYIDGEPIDAHCERLDLGLEDRVRLLKRIALAAHHAHGARIVHRDIKPSNILVARDGVPKLVDFGVAKLLDLESGSSRETTTVVRATPAYASPEQLAGEPTAAPTDVYSLGVVLYELLTGRLPFSRPGAPGRLERIREQDPPLPSRAVTEERASWRRKLGGGLDTIVSKAIRREPEARYSTAEAFAEDLERWLEGETVRARPPSLRYRWAAFVRRHPASLAATAAAIAVTAIFAMRDDGPAEVSGTRTVTVTGNLGRLAHLPAESDSATSSRLVVLPFEDLSPDADQQFLAVGITEELLNALGRIEQLEVLGQASSSELSVDPFGLRAIAEDLNVGLVVGGSVRRDGERIRVRAQLIDAKSGSQRWSDIYERRLDDLFTLQEEVALAIAGELRLELSRTTRAQLRERPTERGDAYELYLRGRYEWSRRSAAGIWNAIEAFRDAIAADPDFALAYAGLADAYRLLPAYGNVSGPEALSLSKAAALRAVALDDGLPEAHTALAASTIEFDHDRVAAEREYQRALELNPREATALRWYGLHLAGNGEFEAALAYVERARSMDPLSPVAIGSVGTVNYFARRPGEAERIFRRALELRPDWATGRAVLGRVYMMAGRVEDATQELERASTLSGGEANDRALLATAYAAAGREDDARAIVEALSQAPGGFLPAAGIAGIFAALGETEPALEWLDRAVELRDTDLKYLNVDPRFDAIRGSSGFEDLLERTGLR